MADKDLVENILADAHNNGFLLRTSSSISLTKTVNMANRILNLLKRSSTLGMDVKSIAHNVDLTPQTVKIYLNALKRLGYVDNEISDDKISKIWFSKEEVNK